MSVFLPPHPRTVRQVRKALGFTQAEAAAVLGIERVSWARYESTAGDARAMSGLEWRYFKHAAGVQKIPFVAAPAFKGRA